MESPAVVAEEVRHTAFADTLMLIMVRKSSYAIYIFF